MNRKLYPTNWEAIATAIKFQANWHCQECGRPCFRPGETFLEMMVRLGPTEWASYLPDEEEVILMEKWEQRCIRATFTLTVAHLNHRPEDCRPDNLRALCSGCHLRYDGSQMALKRQLKAERNGQLNLFGGGGNG